MEQYKKPFYDLIYANREVEELVKKRYPTARIKDASDYIHIERFELELDGVTDETFYPWAISEGFARCCLGFELKLQSLTFPRSKEGPTHDEVKQEIERWCALAKEMIHV